MNDLLGRKINLNDYVVMRGAMDTASIIIARVTGFTTNFVKLKLYCPGFYRHESDSKAKPENTLIINKEDVLMYILKGK